jgi:WD40 repeat protein
VGGVAGSLAQHAEGVLDQIGSERQALVRDIFRHLTTARGTRVSRDRDDLLSAFPDRVEADAVLGALVDARLLTSFETADAGIAQPHRRVEVTHESLLSHWPRLVRWQTQDADGAQLRDQLRQAAQLWEERGRPEEMLWTGTVYQEFRLWRQHYPGGLSGQEQQFADSMLARAQRMQRRRRSIALLSFAVLIATLATVTVFWQRSRRAERASIEEARRAEAGKLFALSKAASDTDEAFAYSLASLELSDQPEVRRFSIELLERGPLTSIYATPPHADQIQNVSFSPDARWLAIAWGSGLIRLYDTATNQPMDLRATNAQQSRACFSADSRYYAVGSYNDTLLVYSVGFPKPAQVLHFRAFPVPHSAPKLDGFLVEVWGPLPKDPTQDTTMTQWWWVAKDGGARRQLGEFEAGAVTVSPSGTRITAWQGRSVFDCAVSMRGLGKLRPIGVEAKKGGFDRQGSWLLARDSTGIDLWNLDHLAASPIRHLERVGDRMCGSCQDAAPRYIAVGFSDGMRVWELSLPDWMGPMRMHAAGGLSASFDSSGKWLLSGETRALAWSVTRRYPVTIPWESGAQSRQNHHGSVDISPDGRWLATSHDGVIRLWPLTREGQPHELHRWPVAITELRFDRSGQTLFASGSIMGPVEGTPGTLGIDVETGREVFRGPKRWAIRDFDVDPTGSHLVSFGDIERMHPPDIVDIRTQESQPVNMPGRAVRPVGFAADGKLLLFRLKKPYEMSIENAIAQTGPDTLFAYELGTSKAEVLATDVEWIHRARKGGFLWKDTSERFWTGEPGGPGVREVKVAPEADQFMQTYSNRRRVDFDSKRIVLGRMNGDVEVYDLQGGPPHLLLGHKHIVQSVTIDPKGHWIASSDTFGERRLWPMPDGTPLQTLPHEEFLAKLTSQSNIRAVKDSTSTDGYSITNEGFPGFDHPAHW